MKTIEIVSSPDLLKYTHACVESDARALLSDIRELEASGATVVSASSRRSAVPNAYRSASKMNAPYYQFDGETIQLTPARLQNRPRGHDIKPVFCVEGLTAAPEGFRVFARPPEGRLELRRK